MKTPVKPTLRTCPKGHQYYKSSDCKSCPVCEAAKKPRDGFLSLVSAPARRAFANAGIQSLQQLSGFTENEILAMHGIGKTSIPILKRALEQEGLKFKD